MQGPASARFKILIVDDEQPVCDLLTRWLGDAGFEFVHARTPAEATALLEAYNIALATLDIALPGGSGLDLLNHISRKYPDTAVVMLTGEADANTVIAALTGGACGYLIKPVAREALLFEVRRGLERRELLIDKRNYTLRLEQRVHAQTSEVHRAYEEAIYRLVSACSYRDVETGGHIKRVGVLSEALARAAGWDPTSGEDMRLAAPMHDIGKVGVPDAILQKPGQLTPDEFAIMQQHTVIGAQILGGSDSPVLQLARVIALCHHEKFDGGGYPAGLHGHDIPPAARMVAIVDVYDALTHGRVYRAALPEAEALSIMLEQSGRHFDPELLELFLSKLPLMRKLSRMHADDPEAPKAAAVIEGSFRDAALTSGAPAP
jgi:putative two-component system response regulator